MKNLCSVFLLAEGMGAVQKSSGLVFTVLENNCRKFYSQSDGIPSTPCSSGTGLKTTTQVFRCRSTASVITHEPPSQHAPRNDFESLALLAIVLLTVVLLAVVLAIVLLAVVLLTIVTIVVNDDGWWRCSAQNDTGQLSRSNGLLRKELSLQVEQGSGGEKGGILLNEGNITNEQVLVGEDDGSRIREELGARWRLRCGRVEGQQDSAIGSLSKGSSRVELRNLGRGSWLCDGLACARDTGNVQVGRRGLRLNSESTVGSHHHKNLARIVAVISLKMLD